LARTFDHFVLAPLPKGRVLVQTVVREGKETSMMSEENKEKTRRFLQEAFNEGNLSVVDEIYASDYVLHDPAVPDEIRGPEGVKGFVQMYRSAFPDTHITVEDQIAEGDDVVTRWTGRGTHQGELFGIPPSGNQIEISGITIDRFSGGKGVESWTNYDNLGLMQQIGAIPEPGQEEEARPAAKGEREEEKGLMDKAKEKLTGQ
jgi:steroid delta-isomerase-like uncharacterized protein